MAKPKLKIFTNWVPDASDQGGVSSVSVQSSSQDIPLILNAMALPNAWRRRAQLYSVIIGLRYVVAHVPKHFSLVTVYTDSYYVFKGCSNWVDHWVAQGWKKRNWEGQTDTSIANLALWKEAYELKQKINNLYFVELPAFSTRDAKLVQDIDKVFAQVLDPHVCELATHICVEEWLND